MWLFFANEDGFLTNKPFKCMMNEFTKLLDGPPSRLECFFISDIFPVHRNKKIVATVKDSDIHMYNIIPISLHWFQIH